jgi:hypothetical protein
VSRRIRAAFLTGGLLLAAVVIARAGPSRLVAMLARVGWAFVPILLLYAAYVGVRAVALSAVMPAGGLRFGDALRVRLWGGSVEVLTSTGPFLAEPAKAWMLTAGGVAVTNAFAAVAIEYLLYTTMSAAVALTAFVLLTAQGSVQGIAQQAIAVAATLTGVFIGAVAFAAVTGIGLIVPALRASGPLVGRARAVRAARAMEPVERHIVAFLHERPAALMRVLVLEVCGQALLVIELWVVLLALGVARSADVLLAVEGGGKLIGLAFFFIPGQAGIMEAVYAWLATAVGLPAAAGITLAVVRRLRSYALAGGGLWVIARFGKPFGRR